MPNPTGSPHISIPQFPLGDQDVPNLNERLEAGLAQNQPANREITQAPAALPYLDQDEIQALGQGSSLPSVDLEVEPVDGGAEEQELSTPALPQWSAGQRQAIVASFEKGLGLQGLSLEDVNQVIQQFALSDLEITEESIQDPANAPEIERLQRDLDRRLDNSLLKGLGQNYHVGADGQFGQNTVGAIAVLKKAYRGEAVELDISPIEQRTRTGCYRASEAMMYNVIHGKDGREDAYTEFDLRDRVSRSDRDLEQVYVAARENGRGRVSVSASRSEEMLNMIDSELESGRPVIVGVTYKKQTGERYNEGITDHFVVISGRGYDENGTYYTFQDPANGGTNKFRLDPQSGRLSGKGDMIGTYDVTLAQAASDVDEATVTRYREQGVVLFSQGQRSSDLAGLQFKLTQMGYDTNGVSGGYGNGTAQAVGRFQEEHGRPLDGGNIDNFTQAAIDEAFDMWQAQNPEVTLFKNGDQNALLRPLQTALTQLGFDTKGTRGGFGNGTEAAVRQFQEQYELPVTGEIDNLTWLKILEAAAP